MSFDPDRFTHRSCVQPHRGQQPGPADRRGFSLLETAVATLLVGMLLVGALRSLGAAMQTHTTVQQQVRATLLAEQLLIEIAALPWLDPDAPASSTTIGPDTDDVTTRTARTQLDDMDDFHLWVESPAATVAGGPLPGADGLSRQIAIFNLSATDPSVRVAANENTGIREIVVTVFQGQDVRATVSAIVAQADQTLTTDVFQHATIP